MSNEFEVKCGKMSEQLFACRPVKMAKKIKKHLTYEALEQ